MNEERYGVPSLVRPIIQLLVWFLLEISNFSKTTGDLTYSSKSDIASLLIEPLADILFLHRYDNCAGGFRRLRYQSSVI